MRVVVRAIIAYLILLGLALLLLDIYNSPIPATQIKSKLSEKQAARLVKKCGGATISDEFGNEKCFYTFKDKEKIKKRRNKR